MKSYICLYRLVRSDGRGVFTLQAAAKHSLGYTISHPGVIVKTVAVVIIVLAVVLAASFIFLREVMVERPTLCRSCHFIAPYYNKWEQSSHRMVPCLRCHNYGPLRALLGQLKVLTGTYTPRPLTNVPDARCLQQGCHDRRLVESRESFTRWQIVFDHKPHFSEQRRNMRLHCRSCHSDIVQGEHMRVSMNVCFLCHLRGEEGEDGISCTRCHRDPKQMVSVRGVLYRHLRPVEKGRTCADCHQETKLGDGSVPPGKCFFCHVDRTERVKDVPFIHRAHAEERQIDCFYCHSFVEHGNIRMARDLEKLFR